MNEKFQAQLIQARRNQILDAAVAVIAEQGFQRTTIKQIAAKAEVADGTIYNYFKNKDDILMGIIARISESELRELHFADAKQVDFINFAHEYIAHRMAEVEAGYPMLKLILTETLANPELSQEIYTQIYSPAFTAAEHYFQYLMEQGLIPVTEPALAARLFASPVLGLLVLRMMGDPHVEEQWQAYSNLVIQMLLNAFGKHTSEAKEESDHVKE
ncbi:MAG: TetR/AcrR family transcriptional regulator [Caldilineaceae bacterium]